MKPRELRPLPAKITKLYRSVLGEELTNKQIASIRQNYISYLELLISLDEQIAKHTNN